MTQMLFVDTTKGLIEQSIDIAREALSNDRMTEAWQNETYRLADQLNNPIALPGAKGVKYDELPKIALPFCDTILREFGKLYKLPPRRYIDSERPNRRNGGAWARSKYDEELTRWHALAEDDEADYLPTLHLADDLTRFHGRTIVRVWPAFRKDSDEHRAGKNYPRLDIFHPGQFDVIADPSYPARALAVILYLSTETAGTGENLAQVWTAKESVMVRNGKPETAIPNPAGIGLPFVGLANYIDPQDYWRAGLARKIVQQNAVFDLGWTHLFSMAINQLHGQMVTYGADEKWVKNAKWGFDKSINLPDKEAKVEILNWNPNTQGMIDVLEKFVERVYWSCNLPTNTFRKDAGVESGAAYRVKNGSILEDRQERASLFGPRERAIWRLAFLVGAAFGIHNISAPPKSIVIDYAEPEIPVPTTEAQQEREWDLSKSLASLVDEYRRKNPDIGDDNEALEELRRNAEINAEFLGVAAAPTLRDLMAKAKAAREAQEGPSATITSDDEGRPAAPAEDVQKTALNGAQVTALQLVVQDVAAGKLTREAAEIMITLSFPAFTPNDVEALFRAVKVNPQPKDKANDKESV